jgi:tetratricopeptide (TPR) repeat protein
MVLMSLFKGIIILFIMSFSAFAAEFAVDSQPSEVEIYIASDANEKALMLGKTPFKQDLDMLIKTYVKKDQFILTLKKKGYEDYNVLLTKTSNVDIKLNVNLKVEDRISQIKDHDRLMMELFIVQKLIRAKNVGDAIKKLDELEKKYGDFSIVAELKATAYYMNKDVENALSYYRRAFALNSENIDAYKMKVYLEKKLGVNSDL